MALSFVKSSLSSLLSKDGRNFPYTIGDKVSTGPIFQLHHGRVRGAEGAQVSVFAFDCKAYPQRQILAQNAFRKLRTLRHPSLTKFLDGINTDTEVYIVVANPLVPLSLAYVDKLEADEVLVGIYNVLIGLDFLHSNGINHNCISLESIFLSENSLQPQWLLGNLEFSTPVSSEVPSLNFLGDVNKQSFIPKNAIPPEGFVEASPFHARDVYAFGMLIKEVMEHASQNEWNTTLPISDMLSPDPTERPTTKQILATRCFNENNLVQIVRTLKDIRGLSMEQKIEFFTSLASRLDTHVSKSVFEKNVLPSLIINSDIFLEPGADIFYARLFSPPEENSEPSFLSIQAYEEHVFPFALRLWKINNVDTRVRLLRTIDGLLKAVTLDENSGGETLRNVLIPEILRGLQDSDSEVYISSFCALAEVIPYALPAFEQVAQTKGSKKGQTYHLTIANLFNDTLVPNLISIWLDIDIQELKWRALDYVVEMWATLFLLRIQDHPLFKKIPSGVAQTLHALFLQSPASDKCQFIEQHLVADLERRSLGFCVSVLSELLPRCLLDPSWDVRAAVTRAISVVASRAQNYSPFEFANIINDVSLPIFQSPIGVRNQSSDPTSNFSASFNVDNNINTSTATLHAQLGSIRSRLPTRHPLFVHSSPRHLVRHSSTSSTYSRQTSSPLPRDGAVSPLSFSSASSLVEPAGKYGTETPSVTMSSASSLYDIERIPDRAVVTVDMRADTIASVPLNEPEQTGWQGFEDRDDDWQTAESELSPPASLISETEGLKAKQENLRIKREARQKELAAKWDKKRSGGLVIATKINGQDEQIASLTSPSKTSPEKKDKEEVDYFADLAVEYKAPVVVHKRVESALASPTKVSSKLEFKLGENEIDPDTWGEEGW